MLQYTVCANILQDLKVKPDHTVGLQYTDIHTVP